MTEKSLGTKSPGHKPLASNGVGNNVDFFAAIDRMGQYPTEVTTGYLTVYPDHICPHCGKCKHCGQPQYPSYPVTTITCNSEGNENKIF